MAEPIRYVVHHRADGAGRKPSPDHAEEQHRVRALHDVNVDEMGHDLNCCRVEYESSASSRHAPSPPQQSRVALGAWLYSVFTRPLCQPVWGRGELKKRSVTFNRGTVLWFRADADTSYYSFILVFLHSCRPQ